MGDNDEDIRDPGGKAVREAAHLALFALGWVHLTPAVTGKGLSSTKDSSKETVGL